MLYYIGIEVNVVSLLDHLGYFGYDGEREEVYIKK